jgi:radical SAM superfamily enzyme YgiQ (UPF0313 family)
MNASPPPPRRARVLLVSANTEDQPHPVYPLALECLGAALRKAGHAVRFFDCWRAGAPPAALADAVRDAAPDLVGVSIRNVDNNQSVDTKYYLPGVFETIAAIRAATRAPIVLGGSGYSLFPREILRASGADAGVAGPGEEILPVLADRAATGKPLAASPIPPGLVHRADGDFVATPPRRPTTVDGLPARDPDLVRDYWRAGGPLNLQVSRGCAQACVYCTYPLLEGRRSVRREAAGAVDEIRALHEATGATHFFVVDSVFNADPARSRAFAEELLRRGTRIAWSAFFTPKGVTREEARLWKASGLEGVEFGTDALCAETLRAYGKPFDAGEARAASEACAEADLPYVHYLIFGGPGETRATMDETIANAEALPRAVICAFVGMRIYPGTPLEQRAREEGRIAPGANLLEPCFYLSPHLETAGLSRQCRELGNRMNWLVVGGGIETKGRMAASLRKAGQKGSLWHILRPGPS